MICVSVGRGRHRMMIAEHQNLTEKGVELVELRLDYIRRAVDMGRLLENRPGPVIVTCRRPEDGGKWMRSEADRQVLLRTAVASGADYVDMEIDVAKSIPRYGHTQRIISYHNFDETPDNLEEIHHQMSQLDPDIIKIATMANNPIDNVKALRLVRDSEIPTVAFCMGEMGMPSRILCGRAGSPLTYATFSEDRRMAPGQLTYKQMVQDFRYDSITKDTRILGVIADPVAHSFSPQVHNACIRELDLNMLYLPFRVPKEYLDEFLEVCPEMGVHGLSVTIPHKETILKCINTLDENVSGIRAANTVVFKNTKTLGFNTDCTAAVESLKLTIASLVVHIDTDDEQEAEEAANDDQQQAEEAAADSTPSAASIAAEEAKTLAATSLAGKRVLILGAGGVARAIAFGLNKEEADVTLTARDYRKSGSLADDLECKSIEWVARANFECDVLINCTPVGMHPNMDETPFDKAWFDKRTIVFDTIYNPEQTLMIKEARVFGCTTITGIDMFVRQAAKQFVLFTGKEPNVKTMRYEVKRATSAARY